MDAAGKDDVFLETVGVGQAEVDIIDHADTVVLVLMPGSGGLDPGAEGRDHGDPDVIVVNKAATPHDTTAREIRGAPVSPRSAAARADRQDRAAARTRPSRRWSSSSTRTVRPTSRPRARSERRRRNLRNEVSAVHLPPAAPSRSVWRRTRSSPRCSTRSLARLDPASAATTILERFDAGEAA